LTLIPALSLSPASVNVAAGSSANVTARFALPLLASGTYSASLSLEVTSAGLSNVTQASMNGTASSTSLQLAPALSMAATQCASATEGSLFSQVLNASGGFGAPVFSRISGALPAGLMLNGQSGLISGVPTVSGSFTAT